MSGSTTAGPGPPTLKQLLARDVVEAARGLLGCVLVRRLPQGVVRATIVETEAYHMREPGCHAHNGKTPRNSVMFEGPGRLYVYFTYGMWHCANVVCEPEGTAAAVLLRAASHIQTPQDSAADKLRLSGPGLLCKGLAIDRELNGANVLDRKGDVYIFRPRGFSPPEIESTTRIGFSFEDKLPWRFFIKGHRDVSPARTGVLKRPKRK